MVASVLLTAGLGVLYAFGYSTDRAWPGRYRRRRIRL